MLASSPGLLLLFSKMGNLPSLSLNNLSCALPRSFSNLSPSLCCILNTFATFVSPPTKNSKPPKVDNQAQLIACTHKPSVW